MAFAETKDMIKFLMNKLNKCEVMFEACKFIEDLVYNKLPNNV